MIRNKNYKKERFFGICLISLVIVILSSISIYLTYVVGDSPTRSLCNFSSIVLSVSRFLAAIAAALSAYFFISYFEELGTIYIGRGDKIFFQTGGAIVTFLITFFLIFYSIKLPGQC